MADLTPWADLTPERQLALREEYAKDPFCLTGTCSLEAKTKNFADWLEKQGVAFSMDDLHRKP